MATIIAEFKTASFTLSVGKLESGAYALLLSHGSFTEPISPELTLVDWGDEEEVPEEAAVLGILQFLSQNPDKILDPVYFIPGKPDIIPEAIKKWRRSLD